MKKERGFTLLEIAIVVGIIGILVVALVPNITSSFETNEMKAAKIKAEAVAKNIKVGIIAGDIKCDGGVGGPAYGGYDPNNTINLCVVNRVCYIGGIKTLYRINDSAVTCEELIDPSSKNSNDIEKTFFISYSPTEGVIKVRAADDYSVLHQEPI